MKNEEYSEKKLRGFTLIELIVVIAIIGVLSAIIVPNMVGYMETANNTADAENARIISEMIAAEAMIADHVEAYTANPWTYTDGTFDPDDHGYVYVSKNEIRVSSFAIAQLLEEQGFLDDAMDWDDRRSEVKVDGIEVAAQYTYDRSKCRKMICKSNKTWYRYQINICDRDGTIKFSFCAVSRDKEGARTSNQSVATNTQDPTATKIFAEKAGVGEPDYITSFGPETIR